jgi:hypothetical protein
LCATGSAPQILDALAAADGNQTRAAQLLGMARRTFVYKMAVYPLDGPRKRSRASTNQGDWSAPRAQRAREALSNVCSSLPGSLRNHPLNERGFLNGYVGHGPCS